MALLSATFSWTSFSQKLHRIQKRLWWDNFPPLFCGSYFLDWKSNLHATLEVLLQDYVLKWRQPIFFPALKGGFKKLEMEKGQLRGCLGFEVSWHCHETSSCENKRFGLAWKHTRSYTQTVRWSYVLWKTVLTLTLSTVKPLDFPFGAVAVTDGAEPWSTWPDLGVEYC